MHLANHIDFVIGVDTHKNSHTLGLVDRTGVEVADTTLVTDAFGYRKMLAWVTERSPASARSPSGRSPTTGTKSAVPSLVGYLAHATM